MKKRVWIILAILTIILLVGIYYFNSQKIGNTQTSTESDNLNSTNIVELKGFAFNPPIITIKAGESITWINRDSAKHTVTSETGSELNSNLFGKDESYSHQFNTAGTYEYYCVPHPSMKGTVVVI